MNYVIYADFETLLIPYYICDNEQNITKEINKHEVSGYSINIVSNHTKKKHSKLIIEVKTHLLNFLKNFVI